MKLRFILIMAQGLSLIKTSIQGFWPDFTGLTPICPVLPGNGQGIELDKSFNSRQLAGFYRAGDHPAWICPVMAKELSLKELQFWVPGRTLPGWRPSCSVLPGNGQGIELDKSFNLRQLAGFYRAGDHLAQLCPVMDRELSLIRPSIQSSWSNFTGLTTICPVLPGNFKGMGFLRFFSYVSGHYKLSSLKWSFIR